ncbi:MAG TPA: hypothetical protein VGH89_09720 [Pseudonocardia sp.]
MSASPARCGAAVASPDPAADGPLAEGTGRFAESGGCAGRPGHGRGGGIRRRALGTGYGADNGAGTPDGGPGRPDGDPGGGTIGPGGTIWAGGTGGMAGGGGSGRAAGPLPGGRVGAPG